jgi:hypothetical protein
MERTISAIQEQIRRAANTHSEIGTTKWHRKPSESMVDLGQQHHMEAVKGKSVLLTIAETYGSGMIIELTVKKR